MGVPDDTAEYEACGMEHIISDDTFEKVKSIYREHQKISGDPS